MPVVNRRSRKGGQILPSHANTEREQGGGNVETSKVSAWFRRLGWRVCIGNGTANLRRNLRVNGRKGRGIEKPGNGKKTHARGNRRKKDRGEKNRQNEIGEGFEKEVKTRIVERMWIRHGRAQKNRDSGKVCERDLDIVGVQEVWEKEVVEIGYKAREYASIGEKREGQNPKDRGAAGVGFLVKEYMFDIIEVVKDTKFDENIWI